MKTVKFLFAALIAATGVNAQTKDAHQMGTVQRASSEERAKMQTDKMKADLSLTEEQVAKVYEINLGTDKKNEKLREAKMTEEERKKAFVQNNEDRKAMLKEVLTAEQYTKAEQTPQYKKPIKKVAPPREPKKEEGVQSKEKSNN